MAREIRKEYSNGEVTVVWQPSKCIHSTKCATGLPQVFDPKKRPWVDVDAASTSAIVEQVKQCPSGALSYFMNNQTEEQQAAETAPSVRVEVMKDGPVLVHGELVVKNSDGSETQKSKVTAFCRCGQSSGKPYCDGTHKKVGFKG